MAELQVPLAPGLANAPSQGHIAFGDSDDQMHVLWVSASSAVPTVRHPMILTIHSTKPIWYLRQFGSRAHLNSIATDTAKLPRT